MTRGPGPAAWAEAGVDLIRVLRSQWHTTERLRHLQMRLLEQQLRYARTNVPWYRDQPPWRDAPSLTELPLIRRADVQANPEAFLSDVGDRQEWRRSHTSGSTGRPLESFLDPRGWRLCKYAFKLRRLLGSGWRPGQRIVVVEAVAAASLGEHATTRAMPGERWLEPRRFLSVFDPPSAHLETYRSYRPHYIYALPSYLTALLSLWGEKERRTVPLRGLMTSGEWLPPERRRGLEDRFGVPLLDVYGSTEFKEVAWQCPRRSGYHVNMESVLVEIVDPEGMPVPPGVLGEVVVTSLRNRAMPLLRYATGDRAVELEGTCGCGRLSQRLDRFEGRTVDVLSLPDGRSLSPYALTTAVEECPGLIQYRIVQRSREQLDVPVVLSGRTDGALDLLRTAVERVVGAGVRVEVRAVPELPRDPSGKCSPIRAWHPAARPAESAKALTR